MASQRCTGPKPFMCTLECTLTWLWKSKMSLLKMLGTSICGKCFESFGNLGCAYHPFVCTLKRSMVHNFRKENHQKNILTNLQMVNSQVRMIKFCIQE